MVRFLDGANRLVWGVPALVLILGVGLLFSLKLGFPQIRMLPRAGKLFLTKLAGKKDDSQVSPFQALCTALAATVGTGNLVGVAGAIALGGPGSIFWMWISAVLGMVTKYAEATLAVHFRTLENGVPAAGPMYMIRNGLPEKWHFLGWIYSFLGVCAAFGVGNVTQINAVMSGAARLAEYFGGSLTRMGALAIGIALALIIGFVMLGGAKRIATAAEILIPFVSGGYIVLCLYAIFSRLDALPAAFGAIFRGAFSPRAVTGGVIGSAFSSLRVGISRGVFTNAAGMGTASIAHGCAGVEHPCEQGLMGIMEVFLDTVVICTLTALVILTSGAAVPYGQDVGAQLTFDAFSRVCGDGVTVFLAFCVCCFAFATVLGWGLYGVRCAGFLLGPGSFRCFALAQSAMVVLGAVLDNRTAWSLAELLNGLMAIPNLIALVLLLPVLKKLTKEYDRKRGKYAAGGTNENIHQCKPL